ncbi:MAG: hypothetical protein LBD10_04815 [Desulfobulbus sp.]|jgi:hypothetical protein|uniref:hypothetical protein n=1 Tax=Desulfobulbus sp. TaxID=895 RepID=UPI00283C48CE|nr:hypothetical protein [Desulfobulbus sp.]MDR2549506.1 hypothetical protein [Desulfobulbus sp.]
MRCPKCGFTSFDHLETCKKCHKYLGDLCTEINGTAYDAPPPLFLTFAANQEEELPVSGEFAEEQDESSLAESATLFAMEEVEASEATPEEEEEQPQEAERYEIEFAGFGDEMKMDEEKAIEMSDDEDFMLEADEPADEPRSAMPSVDFGELDISDLAPPTAEQAEPIRFEQPPALVDLEPVAALSTTPLPTPQTSAGKGGAPGLEDLNISGLDLDAPAKLVTGSAAGKRFLPSVKTGTALDKFEIDLGDLFSDNKK